MISGQVTASLEFILKRKEKKNVMRDYFTKTDAIDKLCLRIKKEIQLNLIFYQIF